MEYLFGAYLILWTLFFGYVFSVSARLGRVEAELQSLRGSEEADQATQGGRGPG